MTTTQKQCLFWGGAAVLAAIYFAPPLFVPVRRDALAHTTKPDVKTSPQSPTPPPVLPDPANGLTGIWQGNASVPGHGVCTLKLEIRRSADLTKFAGFPTLGCMPLFPMLPKAISPAEAMKGVSKYSPVSAILTGTSALGSIKFTVDKQMGVPASGCPLTSFTATPFGTDQLAAEWAEGTCQGGDMVLRRTGR